MKSPNMKRNESIYHHTSVKDTFKFLVDIITIKLDNQLTDSLGAKSLFTNAPPDFTINLILNSIFSNGNKKLLKLGKVYQTKWPSGKSVYPWSCRLWFDSKSGQTKEYTFAIQSFRAWRSALKGQCEEQGGKFTSCAVGKGTERHSPILVW